MTKNEKMRSVPALPLEASHMDFPVAATAIKIHLSKNYERITSQLFSLLLQLNKN
jgi:hypothetical protein